LEPQETHLRKFPKEIGQNSAGKFRSEKKVFCCPRFLHKTAGTSAANAAGKSAVNVIFAEKSAGNYNLDSNRDKAQ